jgi:hypothetical protein
MQTRKLYAVRYVDTGLWARPRYGEGDFSQAEIYLRVNAATTRVNRILKYRGDKAEVVEIEAIVK